MHSCLYITHVGACMFLCVWVYTNTRTVYFCMYTCRVFLISKLRNMLSSPCSKWLLLKIHFCSSTHDHLYVQFYLYCKHTQLRCYFVWLRYHHIDSDTGNRINIYLLKKCCTPPMRLAHKEWKIEFCRFYVLLNMDKNQVTFIHHIILWLIFGWDVIECCEFEGSSTSHTSFGQAILSLPEAQYWCLHRDPAISGCIWIVVLHHPRLG